MNNTSHLILRNDCVWHDNLSGSIPWIELWDLSLSWSRKQERTTQKTPKSLKWQFTSMSDSTTIFFYSSVSSHFLLSLFSFVLSFILRLWSNIGREKSQTKATTRHWNYDCIYKNISAMRLLNAEDLLCVSRRCRLISSGAACSCITQDTFVTTFPHSIFFIFLVWQSLTAKSPWICTTSSSSSSLISPSLPSPLKTSSLSCMSLSHSDFHVHTFLSCNLLHRLHLISQFMPSLTLPSKEEAIGNQMKSGSLSLNHTHILLVTSQLPYYYSCVFTSHAASHDQTTRRRRWIKKRLKESPLFTSHHRLSRRHIRHDQSFKLMITRK